MLKSCCIQRLTGHTHAACQTSAAWSWSICYVVALRTLHSTCCSEALGAVRDFGAALEAAHVPQLPRDLPPPHPVWGAVQPPNSNAARQALLIMLLSAGGWVGGWVGGVAGPVGVWAFGHLL